MAPISSRGFATLDARSMPSTRAPFSAAEMMAGKPVVIRTIDIGADKRAPYMEGEPFHLEQETNPAMGLRGIRLSLEKEELFKTQLRAILRAGAYGEVSILSAHYFCGGV